MSERDIQQAPTHQQIQMLSIYLSSIRIINNTNARIASHRISPLHVSLLPFVSSSAADSEPICHCWRRPACRELSSAARLSFDGVTHRDYGLPDGQRVLPP